MARNSHISLEYKKGDKRRGMKPLSAKARCTQAWRIISKFGGIRELCIVLAEIGKSKNASTLWRWTQEYGFSSGTGGVIPSKAERDVMYAAQHAGVTLVREDFDPRPSKKPLPAFPHNPEITEADLRQGYTISDSLDPSLDNAMKPSESILEAEAADDYIPPEDYSLELEDIL